MLPSQIHTYTHTHFIKCGVLIWGLHLKIGLFHVWKQRRHPYLQRGMKTWLSFRRAPAGLTWRSQPIFACWLKAVDDGEPFRVTFVKMVFEGYESRCWPFISGPITGYLFSFFLWKIMTVPLSLTSSWRVDLILHGLLSIVWNRMAIQVPAQKRTSLLWIANMSNSEVPPESCPCWKNKVGVTMYANYITD